MNNYQQQKQKARERAINWQRWASNSRPSMHELAVTGEHFKRIGKRYGLIKEFKENGII